MLDAIKQALTCYSEDSKISMECTDAVRIGDTVTVTLKFTNEVTSKYNIAKATLEIPSSDKDGKTPIHVAKANRAVKVFSGGNIIIGNRFRDEYSIDYTKYENIIRIYENNTLIYPMMVLNGSKYVEAYPSMGLFSYFPGLKSEQFDDVFVPLSPEGKVVLDSLVPKFHITEEARQALSIYTKHVITDTGFTPDLIQSILYLIDHKNDLADRMLPMDFEVGTYENLIRSKILSSSNSIKWSVLNSYLRTGNPSLYSITKVINTITRTDNDDGMNIVQDDTDTNALSLVSLRDKTVFKQRVNTGSSENRWKFESIKIDPKYFVGIIDPSFTADSAQINIKNQLARSAVISDDKFKVRVMTKDFKPVILDSFKYLSSVILSSDNIDYVNKKLVPDKMGEYNVYQWGEDFYVDSPDMIDYIRFEDSIISQSTAIMPFVNKTQAMRVMISTHMIAEQSLPIIGAKPPMIYTDVNKEVYDESKQVIRSNIVGKVLGVGDDYINIDGKAVKIPQSTQTANHSTVTYEKEVTPGQYVTDGTVLAKSNSFVGEEFATNVPLLTAYTSYHSLEHEDAVVISESAALRFGHPDRYTITVPIKYHNIKLNSMTPTETLDGLSLVKEGAYVKEGDILFSYMTVLNNLGIETERLELIKVPQKLEGLVKSLRFRVYQTKSVHGAENDKYLNFKGLEDLLLHCKDIAKRDIINEAAKTKLSVSQVRSDFEFLVEEPSIANVVFMDIIINIDYINKVKMADKITNLYGGKGTVSAIIPDKDMLRTEDGRVIDIILSPLAILSRANISQMYESLLSLICVTLYTELGKYFDHKPDALPEDVLQSVVDDIYWYNKNNDLKKVYNESKKYGYARVRVSSFDHHFTIELLNSLRDRLKVQDKVRIFDPKLNRYIRTPVRIGYQSFLRLHFFADKRMTSRGGNNGLNMKDRDPLIQGQGRIKSQGQKIGEMELWALKSQGLNQLADYYVEKANKRGKLISDFLVLDLALEEKN